MNKPLVLIDESGTLPDIKSPVIVIAAVVPKSHAQLENMLKPIQKKAGKAKEFKFYTAGDKTKTLFFKTLAQENISIFLLIINKMKRKIPDTPQHFALLCWLLLGEILHFYPELQKITLDRHFHSKNHRADFDKILRNLLGNQKLPLDHVDSKTETTINVADMVAGAVLAKETGKTDKYYSLIRSKIISETKINWAEAKRRFIENKKISLEPV